MPPAKPDKDGIGFVPAFWQYEAAEQLKVALSAAVIDTWKVADSGHAPLVVYVIVYGPPGKLVDKLISPVELFTNKPGVAVNVPPLRPVTLGSGFIPLVQQLLAAQLNEASSATTMLTSKVVDVGHGPAVVQVTVYGPPTTDVARSISPVEPFTTRLVDDEVKEPPVNPVIIGNGLATFWQ